MKFTKMQNLISVLFLMMVLSSCSTQIPADSPTSPVDKAAGSGMPTASSGIAAPEVLSTSIPSPTPPPPPTVLPEPKLYRFDEVVLNKVPKDLLEQIAFITGGGGGETIVEELKPPVLTTHYSGSIEPAIPSNLYWRVGTFFTSPGPKAWLIFADGSKLPLDFNYTWEGTYLEYPIVPGSPLGNYTLEVTQGDFIVKDSVNIQIPTTPIWTSYQGNYWYAGFKPGEKITVLICKYLFQTWQSGASLEELSTLSRYLPDPYSQYINACQNQAVETITADEYGSFQIRVPDGFWVDVQAETSGVTTMVPSCEDIGPTRLKIGASAEIYIMGVNSIPIYTQDGTKINSRDGNIKLVFGPICNPYLNRLEWIAETPDHTLWWIPESSQYNFNWLNPESGQYNYWLISEKIYNHYFLDPIDTQTQASTNQCPDSKVQSVKVGDQVQVCTKSDRLIVHSVPEASNDNEDFRIYTGTQIEIIGGPQCADNSSWWLIRVKAGTKVFQGSDTYLKTDSEGWVREARHDNVDPYYICKIN